MFDAIIWGLVQGLTEFLPISSSGHLVLVPALLEAGGAEMSDPDLATSAVLHLGTLVAVIAYYRRDLIELARFRTEPQARHVLWLLALGTVPAVIGLPLEGALSRLESNPDAVAIALLGTGAILFISTRLPIGSRRLEAGTTRDALIVGVSQALALIPGISRSGSTITAGLARGLDRREAARFSFLLAIPTIAGGGLLSLGDLISTGVDLGPVAVGFLFALVSGYAAIALILRILVTRGFAPFVAYCLTMGTVSLIIL